MDSDPLQGLDDDLRSRLAKVRLAVFDVDGVLTDGRVAYQGEQELQRFDVRDGQGLVWLVRSGVQVAWISGRGCHATARRAAELGARLIAHSGPKRERLEDLQRELDLAPEATLAMGDDLPDLGLAERAAVFCAPADGRPEVLDRAHLVTRAAGGRGAVREVCEALLAAHGRWDAIVGGVGS